MDLGKIKAKIGEKKRFYPQEWLGRSLAYTPYQPRSIQALLKEKNGKDIFFLDSQNFLESAKANEEKALCFYLQDLENLTYLRRYTHLPLIYDFPILDSYQILEALVYGCDSICLNPSFLSQKELKELSDYAFKLGLDCIFHVENSSDITKAIFAKAEILNINTQKNLLSLIPKNKLIIAHNSLKPLEGVEAFIRMI
ncbi:hypothetical protein [Helicobacter burdigaliensis]|uniref:hypothetical protein n=1 Tax=Helicobacter burdigaliensis TaxID=2315334 RepID=UPI000EF73F52|nr:hypothetical protein [Helicobacter burdigaliensis]